MDIQPSKEGSGFHGTISHEISVLGSHLMHDGIRKKVKLQEGWRGRGQASGRKVGGGVTRREWSSSRSYRRYG